MSVSPALPSDLEERAQDIAASLSKNPSILLGWLEESVRLSLAQSRWRSRDRLMIDLRVVEIVMARSRAAEDARHAEALARYGW